MLAVQEAQRPRPEADEARRTALLARGVRKVFRGSRSGKDVRAVDDVSLEVRRGEIYGLLGANGSGKSTLIRMFSTLLEPDAGEVRIFGLDIREDELAVKRLINRVSVEASFFKKLSPGENLAYALRLYGRTGPTVRDETYAVLDRLGIARDKVGEPLEQLSRGMQQKVAIARALLTSPVLLLLDEPTTGLDPRSKLEVQNFVREVRQTHDATILLCTHDLAEAEALADRVGVLDRGELLFLETVPEILKRFGVETLEEAFFAATGREFESETDEEEDEERGVFA